jgi:hypothetical protein
MNVDSIFRLLIIFHKDLEDVEAVSIPRTSKPEEKVISQILHGKEQLEDLFKTLSIEGYLEFAGDLFSPEVTAREVAPAEFVAAIESRFRRTADAEMKILNDAALTESDQTFLKYPLEQITIFSSRLDRHQGRHTLASWTPK